MTADSFNRALLALLVWRTIPQPASTELLLAVANVYTNRSRITGLPLKDCFDPVEGDYPDTRDPRFLRLLQELDRVYEGREEDFTSGSTEFAKVQEGIELPQPKLISLPYYFW